MFLIYIFRWPCLRLISKWCLKPSDLFNRTNTKKIYYTYDNFCDTTINYIMYKTIRLRILYNYSTRPVICEGRRFLFFLVLQGWIMLSAHWYIYVIHRFCMLGEIYIIYIFFFLIFDRCMDLHFSIISLIWTWIRLVVFGNFNSALS